MNKKNKKKNKSRGLSLSEKFRLKKLKKAAKQGKNIYRCTGAAHQPEGCGHEWSVNFLRGHPEHCPKCENKYYTWVNYVDPS